MLRIGGPSFLVRYPGQGSGIRFPSKPFMSRQFIASRRIQESGRQPAHGHYARQRDNAPAFPKGAGNSPFCR